MAIFSDAKESTVFKSETALDPEYLPASLPHREGQVQEIANSIKPILSGRRPYNQFVFGPPGIGKTAVVRFIFQELSEYERVKPIYINCWQFNTRHAVLSKILNELGGIAPRRGVATDEVFDRFARGIGDRSLIIALDEFDQLILNDGSALFYDLLRAGTKKARIGLVGISNNAYITTKLDARVRSSLSPVNIVFPSYSERELLDIVNERIGLAFRAGQVLSGVKEACAKAAAERSGDVRFALECLWKAGRLADETGSKLTKELLTQTARQTGDTRMDEVIASLSAHERKIIELASKKDTILSGELFEQYKKAVTTPVAERTFRNYISRLETLGLLDAPLTSTGQRGTSRIISLRVPKGTATKQNPS